ncbi:MAG TPA: hypothetical protein VIS06_15595, partial [Mycobacteriales bacterium]
MGEPFEQAMSTGRRGRHAAPADSPHPDHLVEGDHTTPADHPVDHLDGYQEPNDRYTNGRVNGHANGHVNSHGQGHANGNSHAQHSGNRTDGVTPYPGYGLPAEWARPPSGLSPASTQPSLDRPDWDEPSGFATAPPADGEPEWNTPPTQPDASTRPEPTWATPTPEPLRPATSAELVVADHGWPVASPVTDTLAPADSYHQMGFDNGRPAPVRDRHAAPEPADWYSSREPDQPHGGRPGTELEAVEHPVVGDQEHRLTRLAGAVVELAGGCRSLAADLYAVAGSRHGAAESDAARAAIKVARLLDLAAEGADGVRELLEAARNSLAGRSATARAAPRDLGTPPTVPQPREATMPPDLPSTAPSYPPVLPLGLRDGAQAAVVARQVEAAR